MKRILLLCSAFVLCAATASAQKEEKGKAWTEWSEKEAMKMLSDSPWSQTQKELTDSPGGSSGGAVTSAAQNGNSANMVMSEGAKASSESGQSLGQRNVTLNLLYIVEFLTAKPVRAATIRLSELQHPDQPAERVAERRTFVDRDFGDYIVVTLKMDGTDRKRLAPIIQSLGSSNTESFKDLAYLERKDGKRMALMQYYAPGPDRLGAKFVFPRTLDGKPFLDANSGEVRVYMEINKTKVSRKFKVADMMYDGKLEY
jgi:hypothetical protein